MLTILTFRFPAIDFAGLLRTLIVCLALIAIPVIAMVVVNLAWPLVAAFMGKLAVAGGLTTGFAVALKP